MRLVEMLEEPEIRPVERNFVVSWHEDIRLVVVAAKMNLHPVPGLEA